MEVVDFRRVDNSASTVGTMERFADLAQKQDSLIIELDGGEGLDSPIDQSLVRGWYTKYHQGSCDRYAVVSPIEREPFSLLNFEQQCGSGTLH